VWLRRGAQPNSLRELVAGILRRPRLPHITGLGYFGPAVDDLLYKPDPAQRRSLPTRQREPWEEAAIQKWLADMKAWQWGGCVGPAPQDRAWYIEQARAQMAQAA